MRPFFHPRTFALAGALLCFATLAPYVLEQHSNAQTLSDGSQLEASRFQQPISLRDRLIVGLKAMSKSDLDYVDRVVASVNAGQLPVRMVDETFFWARKRVAPTMRGTNERRPIIYFRPVMTVQARRIGVVL
jgi:hypothetical protein